MSKKLSVEEEALSVLDNPKCKKLFDYLLKEGVKFYSQIKEAMEFNNGTMSYSMKRLHKAGLIVYEKKDGDQRKYVRISGDAKILIANLEASKKDKNKCHKGSIFRVLSVPEYLGGSSE
jgi:predicted transcriptional regulator